MNKSCQHRLLDSYRRTENGIVYEITFCANCRCFLERVRASGQQPTRTQSKTNVFEEITSYSQPGVG